MKRISEDPVKQLITYELSDGSCIKFDSKAVREYGIEALAKGCGIGHEVKSGRVDVFQGGQKIGTVPAMFEPSLIKSASFMYDPRPGDFVHDGDKWVASWTLGPGDLEAVPGFVWHREASTKST